MKSIIGMLLLAVTTQSFATDFCFNPKADKLNLTLTQDSKEIKVKISRRTHRFTVLDYSKEIDNNGQLIETFKAVDINDQEPFEFEIKTYKNSKMLHITMDGSKDYYGTNLDCSNKIIR